MTSSIGFTKPRGEIISDPLNNLEGEIANLSKEDLKERLLVAEKVMKSLFQRNRELEERSEQQPVPVPSKESEKEPLK